eukprot:scaffold220595_cov23-Tisochrysis_lutea.AAC.1
MRCNLFVSIGLRLGVGSKAAVVQTEPDTHQAMPKALPAVLVYYNFGTEMETSALESVSALQSALILIL